MGLIRILVLVLLFATPTYALNPGFLSGYMSGEPKAQYQTNGGFETGDITGWSIAGAPMAATSADANGGTYSASATMTGATAYFQLEQVVAVTVDTTVRLSGWIHLETYIAGSVNIDLYDASCSLDSSGINLSAANGGWVYYGEDVYIPATCDGVDLRIFADGNPNMTVYFDDIVVREL